MTSASTVKTVYTIEDDKIVTYTSDEFIFSFSSQECYKGFLWIDRKDYPINKGFRPHEWSYNKEEVETTLRNKLLDDISADAKAIMKLIEMIKGTK